MSLNQFWQAEIGYRKFKLDTLKLRTAMLLNDRITHDFYFYFV